MPDLQGLFQSIYDETNHALRFTAPTGSYATAGATIDARRYATFDSLRVLDGTITSGTPNLTSATGGFLPTDVGKTVGIRGAAGAGTADEKWLFTTILAYVSTNAVTLATNASHTVTGDETVLARSDVSAGLATAIAAAPVGGTVELPTNAVGALTSTLTVPIYVTLLTHDAHLLSSVAGVAVQFGSIARHEGKMTINCLNTASSVGVQLGGSGSTQQAELGSITVKNFASKGFVITSTASGAVSGLNKINKLRILGGPTSSIALHLYDANADATHRINANQFGFVSIQNCLGDGVVVDGADYNEFVHLEVENLTGASTWAIKLVKASYFFVYGGDIEGNTGNLSIANDPDVQGVFINANIDSNLGASDTKFSHTFSNNRSVRVSASGLFVEKGRTGAAALFVGPDGTAAADQTGAATNRLQVGGGMTCYRLSSGSPNFYFKGATAGQGYIFDDGTNTLLDMNSTRVAASQNFQVEKALLLFRTSQNLASNGAVTFDASTRSNLRCVLAANATSSSITNPTNNQRLTITWRQDSTGGRTYVWPTNCRFAGNSAPSDTTLNTETSVTFEYDSTAVLWLERHRAVAVPVT